MPTGPVGPTVLVLEPPVERRIVRSLAWLTTAVAISIIASIVILCGRHGLLHLLQQLEDFQLDWITLSRICVLLYGGCS